MQFKKPVSALLAISVSALTLAGTAEAGRRYHHHHGGAAVAGLFGFAAGAILGSALSQPRYYHYREPVYVAPPPVVYEPSPVYSAYAEPWSPEWYAYCDARYRSFDPASGYFRGYDGHYHLCR